MLTQSARLAFRRLSKLSTCRHIAVARGPLRASYHTPSFSARPDNSLVGKMLYRKDGVPRSKWKGGLFVCFVLFAYFGYTYLEEVDEIFTALVFVIRMLQSTPIIPPADLSTPRGAMMHFCVLLCAGMEESDGKRVVEFYSFFIQGLESGQFSPDTLEKVHGIAKEGCEAAHEIMTLLKVKSDIEQVLQMALDLKKILEERLVLIHNTLEGTASMKGAKDIVAALEVMEKKRKKGSDSYDTVD